MDPDIVEQLNEQFREMSDILSQQNSLMAAQVRNMRELSNSAGNTSNSLRDNANANDDNSKSTRRLSNEQDKTTNSVKNFSRGLDFAASSIMTFGKTVMDSSHNFQKYNNVVDGVTGAVADLGKDFGIVGQVLGGIVKAGGEMLKYQLVQADSLLKFNDSVSKLGAINSFSSKQISEMGLSAGFAAKDLDKLTAPIERLGSTFKIIGNGAADSTKKFMEMAAVGSDTRQEFQRLGYSQTELVEAQAGYIELMGGSGLALRSFTSDVKTLQKFSLEYVKNLQTLSEMSGLTAEEQKKQAERAAADMQFQLYLADMNKKIAEASTQAEKENLAKQVELALFTKSRIAALAGEDAARGYGQQIAGGPQTLGLAEGVITGSQEEINRLAQLTKENSLTIDDIGKAQDQMAQNTRDVVNGPLRQAFILSDEAAKLTGGLSSVTEANRLSGLSATEQLEETRKKLQDNQQGTGPAADDKLQVARNQLTEAEIKLRTEFDRFNMAISLAVPAMNAMATAANTAADALKAMKPPEDIGPGIFGGILAAAGIGLGGMAAFKGIRGINALRGGIPGMSGAAPAGAPSVRPGAAPAAGGMFKTPGGILLDPKQAEAYNSLQQQKAEALAKKNAPSKFGRMAAMGRGGLGALGRGAMGLARFAGPLGLALTAGYGLYGAGQGFMADKNASFGGKLLNAGSSGLNALTFGLLGSSAEEIAAKAAKNKAVPTGTAVPGSDTDFNKSVQTFGRLVTSYGRIVTSFGKLVGAFGTNIKAFNIIIKNLNKKLSNLSKLSIKPAGRELGRRTESPEEVFGQSVKMFGGLVTDFGKIVSTFSASIKSSGTYTDAYGKKLSQLDKLGLNRDNKTIAELDEEEDLIEYIDKLKAEFKETTKVLETHREEEIVRHNFNEISMLKFRTNLDIITEKFHTLSQSPMFSSMLGLDGTGGAGGGGGGINNTVLDAIAKAEGTYESGYNTSLGYGKYLPGGKEHNLTEMTLEQVHELGKFMRKQPGNPDSSALGRYQILATSTMLDAAKALNMDLKTTKFDEQTQDKMAMWIAKQQGLGAWQGFTKHPELREQAQSALESGNYGGNNPGFGGADSKAIAELGKYLERTYGVEASRHSAFDGKTPTSGHSKNSKHYKDLAVDINAPGGVREWDDKKWKGVFDRIAADVESKGFKVIWGNNDHKDHIHIETPKIKAAQGGVFDGPSSGYPAELHGSEMVAPLDTNSILMKLATTPATSNTEEMNVTTSLREKETIEKITTQTQETMSELIDKVIDLINAVEDGNDVRRKMLNNSMQ